MVHWWPCSAQVSNCSWCGEALHGSHDTDTRRVQVRHRSRDTESAERLFVNIVLQDCIWADCMC